MTLALITALTMHWLFSAWFNRAGDQSKLAPIAKEIFPFIFGTLLAALYH
jgi:hypothetical protein